MSNKLPSLRTAAFTKKLLKPSLILGILMVTMSSLFAQTMVIGVVNDSVGNLPLPSANVFLYHTTT